MTVSSDWPELIEAAQDVRSISIDGKLHARITYGNEYEDWDADEYKAKCHDCAVKVGQLHVPGCDVERCPGCGGQLISCDCGGTWF
jgi:hypothetical protein